MNWKYILILLLLTCCVVFLLRLYRLQKKYDSLKKANQNLEKMIEIAQIKDIESKLNPHLFKNILNSIQSHIYQSYYTIDKLSNVLDYVLYETNNRYVTPKQEIAFIQSFIDINRVKLNPLFELRVKLKVDEADVYYNKKVIAPLMFVDLIENAFKHADFQRSDAYISITISLSKGVFSIITSNKVSLKIPLKKSKSGFGGNSLIKRLETLHHGKFKLEKSLNEDNFIAHLSIKLYDQ